MTAEEKPRALTRLVILDGTVWNAGDVPPPEVAARIRNPQCWAPVEEDPSPWGPEGQQQPTVDVATVSQPVTPADPATNGIPNLTEQPADTASGAVIEPAPGTVNGAPLPEPEQPGQAVTAEPVAEQPAPAPPLPEPPRSGKGSSETAWFAYASQFGIDIPAGTDRNAIIAQLKESGHIQ